FWHVAAQTVVHDQLIVGAIVFGGGLCRRCVRQEITQDVGPKLVVAGPVHPARGPTTLGVGREYRRATQLILPANQQPVGIYIEDRLCGGLGDEPRVSAERGGRFHRHARENLGLLHNFGRDWFLDGRRSSVFHHVLEQDLLESGRIIQEMRLAV